MTKHDKKKNALGLTLHSLSTRPIHLTGIGGAQNSYIQTLSSSHISLFGKSRKHALTFKHVAESH